MVDKVDIQELSTIDDDNQGQWTEGGTRVSDLNNAGRADQGTIARWFADWNGSKPFGGTATAFTFTSETKPSAYYAGLRVRGIVGTTNEAEVTLSVDAIGADPIVLPDGSAPPEGAFPAGAAVTFTHNGSGQWIAENPWYSAVVVDRPNLSKNGRAEMYQVGAQSGLTGSATVYAVDCIPGLAGSNFLCTFDRLSVTSVPNVRYMARFQREAGQTGTAGNLGCEHPFEARDIHACWNDKVSFGFWALAGANFSPAGNTVQVRIFSGTGSERARGTSGYTGEIVLLNTTIALTTSAQWFSFTSDLVVPPNTTQMSIFLSCNTTGTAGAADDFRIGGWDIVPGSVPPPHYRPKSYREDERDAFRYFQRLNYAQTADQIIASGYKVSSVLAEFFLGYEEKRATPQLTATDQNTFRIRYQNNLVNGSPGTVAFGLEGLSAARISVEHPTAGTGTEGALLLRNSGSTTYVDVDARL